ncbi:MAG: hypothetical protein NTW87_23160 [Planctomycetota bacterium]|nr:hypothetical protein [Planctomycetota bacterium]
MRFWTRVRFACAIPLCCVWAGVVTPLATRAESNGEKKDAPTAPAAVDAPTKPLALGEIAYTGGAFTWDGQHFVYAILPKDKSQASELRAADTKSGKVESLGLVPLLQQQPATADMFRWSMGVLAAANDLATVYMAQYGPNEDLAVKAAIAWGVKEQAVVPAKRFPDLESLQKERVAGLKNVKLTLDDLDAEAVKQRKTYQPVEKVPTLVGRKELTVEVAGSGKETASAPKSLRLDVTEAFRDLYAAAVADYPQSRMPMDSGKVLVSDSIEPVAQCGKWVLVRCGFYAHYGIHGRGYDRLAAINVEAPRLVVYPGIGHHSASGLRTGPIDNAFLPAPDGKCVAAISSGHLALYRVPQE